VREADNLATFMCQMSWKSGSLNLLEPSGPHRACFGPALPLPFRIQKLARRPTVMRFQLFYSVTPGSCWYSTVKRAVPPIRGEGKSVQITGAQRSATQPRVRICCTCFDIQQVRPCWEPEKLFHWGPNPLSAALNRGLQFFKKSIRLLKILGARNVT
jgi:hypothetical protein